MTPQRTQTFVPLTAAPAPPSPRDFAVNVISNGEQPPGKNFQSLAPPRPAPGPSVNGEKSNCEPQVSVQREGGRVTHLRIHCSCGQVMDLACLYEKTE